MPSSDGHPTYPQPTGWDSLRFPPNTSERENGLVFTLGHCSDWHATPLEVAPASSFLNKRVLGLLSWKIRRSRVHRAEVLEALLDDLREQNTDHIAITGDLTNVALEHEFVQAANWLERLGLPDRVTVIPGNHDAYVAVEPARSWDYWSPFMHADANDANGAGARSTAPTPDEYPIVRVRDDVAIVGLCSARPTPWFMANGWLGAAQLSGVELALRSLGDRGLCRVVCVHHPPTAGKLGARRRLADAPALRDVLSRVGAELVLHGHRHRQIVDYVAGPSGAAIPVVCVPSASDVGEEPDKRARYHVYRIEREPTGRFRVVAAVRGYDAERGGFRDEGERSLSKAEIASVTSPQA